MPAITINDTLLQGPQSSWQLDILEEQSTLREVIRSRIYQEISEYNASKRTQFLNFSSPKPSCQYPSDATSTLDWQVYYKHAITTFEQRSYIVLIDERQVSDLDRPIQLSAHSTITFLKLVPLIGG
jgi:hypothetical protein